MIWSYYFFIFFFIALILRLFYFIFVLNLLFHPCSRLFNSRKVTVLIVYFSLYATNRGTSHWFIGHKNFQKTVASFRFTFFNFYLKMSNCTRIANWLSFHSEFDSLLAKGKKTEEKRKWRINFHIVLTFAAFVPIIQTEWSVKKILFTLAFADVSFYIYKKSEFQCHIFHNTNLFESKKLFHLC